MRTLNFSGTRNLFTSFLLLSIRLFLVLFWFLSLTYRYFVSYVVSTVTSTFSHAIVCWQLFDMVTYDVFAEKNSSALFSWVTSRTFTLSYGNLDGRAGRLCFITVVHFKLLNAPQHLKHNAEKHFHR